MLPELSIAFTGNIELHIHEDVEHVILDGVTIDDKLWQLAGAFDGSILDVTIEQVNTIWGEVQAFVLTVNHPELLEKPMVRKILSVEEGAEINVMDNVEFYLKKPYRGQGIGRSCLLVEAVAAHDLAFIKIVANAANHPDVGWVVWPQLGYDAEIDDDILMKMQVQLDLACFQPCGAKARISDLWDQGLFNLWEEHGSGCIMEFDVSSGESWSMKRLMNAVQQKG